MYVELRLAPGIYNVIRAIVAYSLTQRGKPRAYNSPHKPRTNFIRPLGKQCPRYIAAQLTRILLLGTDDLQEGGRGFSRVLL